MEASSSVHDEHEAAIVPQPGKISSCSLCWGILCFPVVLPGSLFTVNEKEEVVTLHCGAYTGVYTEPGIHCSNCCGRELRRISKQKSSINLHTVKIVDKNGNPIIVSGVVLYSFQDTRKVAIDVANAAQFVETQALAVMKQVISRYPFEHWDDDQSHEDCLKTETDKIQTELVRTLQKYVSLAGVKVHDFKLNEISYAPEIAQSMLKRQQAQSLVAARRTIVEGAVQIAVGAVSQLEKRGTMLEPEEKTRLVSNMLVVICGESQVIPTLNLNN